MYSTSGCCSSLFRPCLAVAAVLVAPCRCALPVAVRFGVRSHPPRLPLFRLAPYYLCCCLLSAPTAPGRHQAPTVQGGGSAVGLVELTVGEDYLPLHEMSTDSKRTTCLPPHMVCEVHHTKSGYEQLESRSSPCRPTRSSTSPKRMRYDLFRPQFEAESPSGRSARSAFCRTSRSQMGFSQHVPSSIEASKWLGDRRRGCPRYFGR